MEQAAELGRACPDTRVLSVGDRESDIFALFARQVELAPDMGLLVRANAGCQRRVQVAGPDQTWQGPLFARLDQVAPVVTDRQVVIRARGGRQGRVAQTEIRVERVELRPPSTSRGAVPIPVWAVDVRETQPPAAGPPLHWLLLASATDGAATAEAAQRLVRQYELRWGIEEFFRLLKTGAGIEDRQLQDAASLAKALAFDAIETYRVFSLQRLAREAPGTPAATVLEPDETACLHDLLETEQLLPPQERGRPPAQDIRSVTIRIARLVGFQPSKRQPLPGPTLLWRGYQHLRLYTKGWRTARAGAHGTDRPACGALAARPGRLPGRPLGQSRRWPGPSQRPAPLAAAASASAPQAAWTERHVLPALGPSLRGGLPPAFPTHWLACWLRPTRR